MSFLVRYSRTLALKTAAALALRVTAALVLVLAPLDRSLSEPPSNAKAAVKLPVRVVIQNGSYTATTRHCMAEAYDREIRSAPEARTPCEGVLNLSPGRYDFRVILIESEVAVAGKKITPIPPTKEWIREKWIFDHQVENTARGKNGVKTIPFIFSPPLLSIVVAKPLFEQVNENLADSIWVLEQDNTANFAADTSSGTPRRTVSDRVRELFANTPVTVHSFTSAKDLFKARQQQPNEQAILLLANFPTRLKPKELWKKFSETKVNKLTAWFIKVRYVQIKEAEEEKFFSELLNQTTLSSGVITLFAAGDKLPKIRGNFGATIHVPAGVYSHATLHRGVAAVNVVFSDMFADQRME